MEKFLSPLLIAWAVMVAILYIRVLFSRRDDRSRIGVLEVMVANLRETVKARRAQVETLAKQIEASRENVLSVDKCHCQQCKNDFWTQLTEIEVPYCCPYCAGVFTGLKRIG